MSKADRRAAAVVWALGLGYTWLLLDRGWVPHDEGTLAQSAVRILQGEVPHRDFEEIYTGGLTYLNALAFSIWGERLMAMRYMAFLFFAAWIPLLYYLARRWMPPPGAALVTLTAVVWSYPNYTAAMPSWYLLYFATGTVAFLTRYLETSHRLWLLAAGASAGAACLFKVVGLYAVAGSLLWFVYLERRAESQPRDGASPGGRGYSLFVSVALLLFAGCIYLLVQSRLAAAEFVQFVLPAWVCVGVLLANEWLEPTGSGSGRLRSLLALIGPYLLGFALAVGPFLAFFLWWGALDELLTGVLITPFRRLSSAALSPPPLATLVATAVVGGALVLSERLEGRPARLALAGLGLLALTLLTLGGVPGVGQLGYLSLSQSVPLLVTASAVLLLRPRAFARPDRTPERLAILTFTAAVFTLVQYPFSTPTYFAFVAPLILVMATAVTVSYARASGPAFAILLAFYTTYAVLWFTPWQLRVHNSRGLFRDAEVRTLLPGRAGLKVSLSHWSEYEALVPFVAAKAGGETIFASPDCPEVYFLTRRQNPTRSLFDFFDEQEGRAAGILELLERRGVRVAVVNNHPLFSPRLEPALARALATRYPHDSVIGRFTVRWQ